MAHLIDKEPASEDLEQAAIDYDSCRPALYGEDDEGDYVEYIEVRKDAFIAGAQWQREQMMKDAVEGYVSATIYFAKHCSTDIAEIQVKDSKTAAKVGEKVKVIIIKE